MAAVLTTAATLVCVHTGTLTITASQAVLTCGGAPALLVTDLLAATVTGCKGMPKPCTKVLAVTTGRSPVLSVSGTAVVLGDATGTTDFGTFLVQAAGQSTLDA